MAIFGRIFDYILTAVPSPRLMPMSYVSKVFCNFISWARVKSDGNYLVIKKLTPRLLIAPFFPLMALIGVLIPILMPIISRQPQIYKDIIIEFAPMLQNLNRSGELRLLYCTIAASAVFVILWHYRMAKRKEISCEESKLTLNDAITFLLLVPCFAQVLFLSSVDGNRLLVSSVAVTLASFGLLTYRNILLSIVLYFAIMALTAVMVKLNKNPQFTEVHLLCLTVLLFAAILLAERYIYKKIVWWAILALQNLIPLVFIYFLYNQYNNSGELVTIQFDRGYRYLVWFGIAVIVLFSLCLTYAAFKKNCRGVLSLNDLIFPTTVCSIFIFNNVGMPVPNLVDWHHSAEHFVTFQQVVDFGKTLYGDFLSAAGCFPMVYGFVQRLLLDNTVASWHQGNSLLFMLSFAVSGLLMIYAFGRKFALFVALGFVIAPSYTRVLFLLPLLLVLMLPRVVANRHLWLQIYVLNSILLFLFYPLYGGAYILGGLPFAIVQIRQVVNLKQNPSKWIFIAWCVVALAAVSLLPLLLRLMRHLLIMASQTTLADGISLFDHEPKEQFMAWAHEYMIRKILYFCTVYGLHIFCVLLPFSLCVAYLLYYKNKDKYTGIQFFAFSFSVLMIPALYSYTTVRMDYGGDFLFRFKFPFALISVVLLGSIWRYGGMILTRKSIFVSISFLLTINIIALPQPLTHADKLVKPPYLDKSWQIASDELQARFPRLGAVFLRQHDIDTLSNFQEKLEKIREIPAPLFNIPPGQLGYFVFGKEASVTVYFYVFRSTAAQQNAIHIMEQNPPICFRLNTVAGYVIYRWLQDAGYIISKGVAIPGSLAEYVPADAVPDYSIFDGFDNLHNIANALGKSISSLMPLFEERHIGLHTQTVREKKITTITMEFERNIQGKEVDFIFASLSDNARPTHIGLKTFLAIDDRQLRFKGSRDRPELPRLSVRILWAGPDGVFDKRNSMLMAFGDGKLLVPLGANPWWLNGEARTLKLEISGDFADDEIVVLNAIKLLQFKPTARRIIADF